MPRTKMTRHELKEQDEITTSLQKFTEFVVRYKKELTTGVSIAAALAIIIFGWTYYRSTRNAKAEAELSQAIDAFNDTANIKSEKERYEKTLAAAQKTYDQYRSLPVGNIALYYVGLSQDGLGDTAKSVQSLEQVAANGDSSVKAVAQFALGSVYKKHGDNQKAIDIYKRLFDTGGYSKAAVAYELASVYEANKQLDQAKDYYQKVVSEFPDSPFRTNADDALKRLGVTATPPAAIQKPPILTFMSKYFVDLKDLGHEKISFAASFEPGVVDFGTESVQQVGPLDWSASAERAGDEIRVAGALKTLLGLPCSRCLEPARILINKPFDLFFRQREEGMFDEEVELGEDDTRTAFFTGTQLAIADILREQVLLALPMKALCKVDCKGLCPHCGTNLNAGKCDCPTENFNPHMDTLLEVKRRLEQRDS